MYDYLKKYVGKNDLRGTYFLPVKQEEIEFAEKRLGVQFPKMLREFYQKIGTGILSCGEKYPEMLVEVVKNDILPPSVAVDFMQGILEHPEEMSYMSEFSYEMLKPGDLPFFEMYDSSHFMLLKLNSENPNAVWTMTGKKIEDSFEKFIWRLYYESPCYYDEIIEKYNKK